MAIFFHGKVHKVHKEHEEELFFFVLIMCFLVQNLAATPVFSLLTVWTPLCHCNVRNPPGRGSQPSALLSLRRGSSAIPVRDDKESSESGLRRLIRLNIFK